MREPAECQTSSILRFLQCQASLKIHFATECLSLLTAHIASLLFLHICVLLLLLLLLLCARRAEKEMCPWDIIFFRKNFVVRCSDQMKEGQRESEKKSEMRLSMFRFFFFASTQGERRQWEWVSTNTHMHDVRDWAMSTYSTSSGKTEKQASATTIKEQWSAVRRKK